MFKSIETLTLCEPDYGTIRTSLSETQGNVAFAEISFWNVPVNISSGTSSAPIKESTGTLSTSISEVGIGNAPFTSDSPNTMTTYDLDSETDSLDSETDSLDSETDSLDSETDSLDSETDSLNSETDSLDSETDSLDSETDSLDSETDSLDSETDSLDLDLMKRQIEAVRVRREMEEKGLREAGRDILEERQENILSPFSRINWETKNRVGRAKTLDGSELYGKVIKKKGDNGIARK
ncbi:hypothetical protein AGMMS49949_00040 [Alphaproteobacteria bacterium]|nr:hypothetical protein AGMMS49949_00040 [Alphaproteobacteria bacterium]